MDPVLMVVGGGREEYRGYILDRVSRHYRIVQLSPETPTWEKKYVLEHVPITAGDDEGVLAAAREVAGRREVAGVVTYQEPCIGLVARIAALLGLPGMTTAAADACRDKYAARRALAEAGVPTPRFQLVHTEAEAVAAANRIGYPVVVKPRGLTASFGVSLAADEQQAREGFRLAGSNAFPEPWGFEAGVLIEEYLDGQEISVDCAVHNGRIEPVVFARKLLGLAPYFNEIGHVIAPPEQIVPDGDTLDATIAAVRAAHDAMGITDTVTHTEVRLTAAGPRVIEVNGRLGGGTIPSVALVAGGPDLAAASADIAVGAEVRLSATQLDGVAGIRFLYSTTPGTITGRAVPDREPDWIRQVTWLVHPGEAFQPEPGRYHFARVGYVVVTADDVEQCLERMTWAERNHRLAVS